jgi:hypothetical protein
MVSYYVLLHLSHAGILGIFLQNFYLVCQIIEQALPPVVACCRYAQVHWNPQRVNPVTKSNIFDSQAN